MSMPESVVSMSLLPPAIEISSTKTSSTKTSSSRNEKAETDQPGNFATSEISDVDKSAIASVLVEKSKELKDTLIERKRGKFENSVAVVDLDNDDDKGSLELNVLQKQEPTEIVTKHKTLCDVQATGTSCPRSKSSINFLMEEKIDEVLNISLFPKVKNALSEYNMLLTQNIELFKISNNRNGNTHTKGIASTKVGLRCKHCGPQAQHVTAASFFPSSINSISSGIGTIGARHFIGGKCPSLSCDTLNSMKQLKKISQQQTRVQGRISLDAHCRELAKRENLTNLGIGGIDICKDIHQLAAHPVKDNDKAKTKLPKVSSSTLECDPDIEYTEIDRFDASAFVEGAVEHFWECKHCRNLPNHWRATGSVVFSSENPTLEQVKRHLNYCQGKKPLLIPRDATIETKEHEDKTSVFIKWDHFDRNGRKSRRMKRRSVALESAKKRRKLSITPKLTVKEDVEDDNLVTEKDKELTTDFAHFTVKQLKKCYLTKSGGSRGNCPLGYPGLACSHCAGTAQARRFFYTSADHLRNSFSHIPSHLAICSKCPDSVKQKISEYKTTRSKQKAQLKNGDHKKFIDGLWGKLHGPGGGILQIEEEEEKFVEDEDCDEDSTLSSLTDDGQAEFRRLQSRNYFRQDTDQIPIRPSSSELVSSGDRKEITDYMYYTMLQMIPKTITITGESVKQDEKPISEDSQVNSFLEQHQQEGLDAQKSNVPNDTSDDAPTPEAIERYHTIVSRYCNEEEYDEGKPHIRSADELYKKFPEIANQLLSCTNCPDDVKEKLRKFKSLRATQEAVLKRGAQKKYLNTIWMRLNRHFQQPPPIVVSSTAPPFDFTPAVEAINDAGLLIESDRELVTQFTFFTMEQMRPCSLDKSGNGSRSMFHHGFPGLECIHCADSPSARKFFYRTADILSGNYAHIPNHVLTCKHCPPQTRRALADKKKIHTEEKMRLQRGSQRIFFNNVWGRLHDRH